MAKMPPLAPVMHFLPRFWREAGPYWQGKAGLKAWSVTLCLIGLTLTQVIAPILLNRWNQELFDALEQKAFGRMGGLLLMLSGIILGNMAITSTHLYFKRKLQLGWRQWLTHRVVNRWMHQGKHYLAGFQTGEHDNPDGRIAEDVRITTEVAIDLAHSLFYCVLLLISFTQILWTLSGADYIPIGTVDLYLPGHLVWIAIVYAMIGTTVASMLGRPLVQAVNIRQTREADFRFGLVHARENSESIALLKGETEERRRFHLLFAELAEAWGRQTRALVHIFLFSSGFSVLSAVFPVLIASPRYFAGMITLGVLMQTAQAFQQMENALSWPIDNLARVAEWKASVERVLGLLAAVDAVEMPEAPACVRAICHERNPEPELVLDKLSVGNPDGTMLISDFSGTVTQGEHVLIGGDPGAALKLFKVIAGLWPWGKGRVVMPAEGGVFFLSQRPYLPTGSLHEVLTYPCPPEAFSTEQSRAALRRVELGDMGQRINDSDQWDRRLTLGEQQKLAFARLLLHRPQWIFLQEATDAMTREDEGLMMTLIQTDLPQATVLTVGYHAGLDTFHNRKLVLVRSPDGLVLITDRRHGERMADQRGEGMRIYSRLMDLLRGPGKSADR